MRTKTENVDNSNSIGVKKLSFRLAKNGKHKHFSFSRNGRLDVNNAGSNLIYEHTGIDVSVAGNKLWAFFTAPEGLGAVLNENTFVGSIYMILSTSEIKHQLAFKKVNYNQSKPAVFNVSTLKYVFMTGDLSFMKGPYEAEVISKEDVIENCLADNREGRFADELTRIVQGSELILELKKI